MASFSHVRTLQLPSIHYKAWNSTMNVNPLLTLPYGFVSHSGCVFGCNSTQIMWPVPLEDQSFSRGAEGRQ